MAPRGMNLQVCRNFPRRNRPVRLGFACSPHGTGSVDALVHDLPGLGPSGHRPGGFIDAFVGALRSAHVWKGGGALQLRQEVLDGLGEVSSSHVRCDVHGETDRIVSPVALDECLCGQQIAGADLVGLFYEGPVVAVEDRVPAGQGYHLGVRCVAVVLDVVSGGDVVLQ